MLKKSFLFNLLLIAVIVIGLLFLFFNSLNWLTNHGKQTTVPKLMGKKMSVAVKELEALGFRINIDSTYQGYKDPLEVLFQEPEAGMSVKVGRTIFLTVNRQTPPSIEMPNLVNMSFRNALLTMHSYNLEMGDTSYRPDLAAGAVLEQWVKGKQIVPGTLIPFGTRIDLVVGEGLSSDQVEVPNLIGKTWAETKALLDSLSLTSNPIWEGKITDSNNAIVYMQQPEALNELDFKNSIPQGDIVDLRILQNPSQEILDQNQPGSKKLTGDSGLDSNGNPIDDKSVNTALPAPKKEIPDSLKKKKYVPGMNVHTPQVADVKDKNNKSAANTKSTTNAVNGVDKPKPKPKPKTDEKKVPAKNNDQNPNDEYN